MNWFNATKQIKPLYHSKAVDLIPKTYISGEQDYLFIPSVKELVDSDHNSEFIVLENSGHVCNIENAIKFNEISVDFIEKQEQKELSIVHYRSS